ncbi:MAG: class I SAM-dependent methyltransferase [Candidatus Pacearchaeota archaeon]|nr:class I SAM-dependent methyltransferase [Candidatus Pacearchaeota archaeon]
MDKKWTGQIHRPLRVWQNPKLSDDIYLHFSELLKAVKSCAPKIKGVVLDVGAGTTPYKKLFKFEKYITLDNHSYSGIDITADITKRIPLNNGSIDSVVCFQVLEHVKNPKKAVSEIHRVLKKNGVCLLTTHMAAPLHGEPNDYYRFSKYALQDLFKEFNYVKIRPNGGAVLSIIQLIVWGISEKLPNFLAKPLIIILNKIGKMADKIFYSDVFTINYSVFATK